MEAGSDGEEKSERGELGMRLGRWRLWLGKGWDVEDEMLGIGC